MRCIICVFCVLIFMFCWLYVRFILAAIGVINDNNILKCIANILFSHSLKKTRSLKGSQTSRNYNVYTTQSLAVCLSQLTTVALTCFSKWAAHYRLNNQLHVSVPHVQSCSLLPSIYTVYHKSVVSNSGDNFTES